MISGAESAAAQQQSDQVWQEPQDDSLPPALIEALGEAEYDAPPERSGGRPLLAAFLILLTIGWLTACSIILYRTWQSASLVELVSWIATMSVPPALLALIWLVFGRTSRSETEKFTRAVSAMRNETQALDKVLGDVAERLAANRMQLSDDTARLMKLGEEASDRLGRVTHYLSREADGLKVKSQAVEAAAAQARVDLGVVLADLPQAEHSARSFSEALREAGVTAHERARALEAQLSAIAARAQDADAATGGAAERLSAHIARIESSAGVAAQQLEGTAARLDAAVDAALGRTTDAVEATRVALDAQAQGLFAAVEQSRGRFSEAGADAARTLFERIDEMQAALAAQSQELFAAVDQGHTRFSAAGSEASAELAQRLDVMQSALSAQSTALFAAIDESHARLSASEEEASRRLGERLESVHGALASQSGELFATIEESRARLAATEEESGRKITERLEATHGALASQSRELFATIEEGRARLLAAEDEANRRLAERVEATHSALAAQAQTLFTNVEESEARFSTSGAQVSGELSQRLEAASQLVERISAGIIAQEQASGQLVASLGSQIASLDERLSAVGQRADDQSAQMATALAGLRDATATLRQEVDASTQEAVALVGRTQDMAGVLDQVGERLRSDLPPMLSDVEQRAEAMRNAALAAVEPVQALQAAAAGGAERLKEAEQLVAGSRDSLEALLAGIDGGVAQIDQRLRELAGAATQADDAASLLVRETGPELVEALVRVREAARAAANHARETIMGVIPESAASLQQAAQQALGETIGATVRDQIGELEASSQRAAAVARKASERLTRQLLTLGEGAAALEAKITEERALRDEQERDLLPRRVALLIESLNSTAIDVTKILSNDVTDTAWQAYLKGDRGVFTRRAVRLLDSGQAREIQRHYDQEPEFREQVNRYISDFEAMLRRVLGDGDGNTLAVTLLSSDMGKLYVALAQAIQHLRV